MEITFEEKTNSHFWDLASVSAHAYYMVNNSVYASVNACDGTYLVYRIPGVVQGNKQVPVVNLWIYVLPVDKLKYFKVKDT